MAIDVTKENLCVNKIVGQKTENLNVEGDIIVPDIKPDILNTINTSGNVCIYKKEVLDGKIKIEGEVNIYVIYLADNEEGATRGLYTSLDFSNVIEFEGCSSDMSIDEIIDIKSIECKILNGRKINVKANLQLNMSLYSNEEIEVVKQINNLRDIQSLESKLKINSLIGEGTSKTYAKDTIVIENIDNLAEILKMNLSIVNRDTKISYNKVLGKAEVEIKMLYLTEDNRIKMVENRIPVMGFVDIENVQEENICDMKYELKNVVVKPNSVEEHSVYIEIEIELCCRVYENKEINLIEDLYSPSECIEFVKKSINTMSNKATIKNDCNIREKIAIPEIGEKQIYDVDVMPTILTKNITNGRVMYEGEIELSFIYASNNVAGIDIKQIKLPFNFNFDSQEIKNGMNIQTQIEVKNQDFIIGNDGYIDGKIDLEFTIDISNTISISIINEINIDENRDREIYSMIIYFVKPQDTLWKIAKRFKSTIKDIVRVNQIEDENKIYPGQQLFIPKYVETNREQTA